MRLPRRLPRGVERAAGARVARDAALELGGPGARIVLGPGAVVGRGCTVRAEDGAVVELSGVLGAGCRVLAHDRVEVAAGAVLGDRCALLDTDLVFEDVERPVRQQGLRAAPIRIGAGAVLGPGAVVLGGVRVGAGAHVLAGSVVTRDVPAGARVAGSPARAAA